MHPEYPRAFLATKACQCHARPKSLRDRRSIRQPTQGKTSGKLPPGRAGRVRRACRAIEEGRDYARASFRNQFPDQSQFFPRPCRSLSRRKPAVEEIQLPRRPRRRSGDLCCIVRGSPCMCIKTTPASDLAATSGMSGSPSNAVTSLMISAPPLTASCATTAFEVSMEMTISLRARRARITGTTRLSSSSSVHRLGPGASGFAADVDDLRAFAFHAQRMSHRGFGIEKVPSVGKRVRRHIEHSHDNPAMSEIERAAFEFPDHKISSLPQRTQGTQR